MAKINKVSAQPQYWLVRIDVTDPDCLFSIKSQMTYQRVVKAVSPNAATKAAANYCNKYKKIHPGVDFKYSTKDVTPYYYPIRLDPKPEDSTGVRKIKV